MTQLKGGSLAPPADRRVRSLPCRVAFARACPPGTRRPPHYARRAALLRPQSGGEGFERGERMALQEHIDMRQSRGHPTRQRGIAR